MKKISKHIEYNIPIDLLIPPWFLVANNTYFLGLPDSNILAQSLRCFLRLKLLQDGQKWSYGAPINGLINRFH